MIHLATASFIFLAAVLLLPPLISAAWPSPRGAVHSAGGVEDPEFPGGHGAVGQSFGCVAAGEAGYRVQCSREQGSGAGGHLYRCCVHGGAPMHVQHRARGSHSMWSPLVQFLTT